MQTSTTISAFLILHALISIKAEAQDTKSEPPSKEENKDTLSIDEFEELSEEDLTTSAFTVTSTRLKESGTQAPRNRIDQQELQANKFTDPHRIVKSIPGVYVRDEDGFGLRPNIGIRGVSSNRSSKITLLEDNVLLGPAPYSAPAAYYFPITTRMVGVDVYKGPSSLLHGPQTIGGAINWKGTQIPEKSQAKLDVAAGRYRDLRLLGSWGTTWNGVGLLLEGSRIQSDGFKQLDNEGSTGFEKNEIIARASMILSETKNSKHLLELKAGYSDEISNETYLGLSETDFIVRPLHRYSASQLDKMNWHRTQVRLDYNAEVGKHLQTTISAYRHDFSRVWKRFDGFVGNQSIQNILTLPSSQESQSYLPLLNGTRNSLATDEQIVLGTNDRQYVSQGVQASATLYIDHTWGSQNLLFGGRFHVDQVVRDHTKDLYTMNSGSLVPTTTTPTTSADQTDRTFAGSFYVSDEIKFGEHFVFTPIVLTELIRSQHRDRQEPTQDKEHIYTVILPGIAAQWQPINWADFFIGINSGFSPSAPSAEKNTPEESVNYELGTRLRHDFSLFEVTGFFTDYSNLTDSCTTSGTGCAANNVGTQFNAGRAHIFGIESQLSQLVETPWGFNLVGKGTYTLLLSSFRSSFDSSNPRWGDVQEGDELPYMPKHQANFQIGAEHPTWSINLSISATDSMRDTAGSGSIPTAEKIPAYATLDLGAGYRITPSSEVYLHFTNLFDARYIASRRPFGVRPGRPLTAMLGFKYNFENMP